MRAPFTFLTATLLLFLRIANAINLSNFQSISGFSTRCTNEYNTELQGCSESDFTDGNPCSANCIASLDSLTTTLNEQCKGTSAMPTTLMGLFYIQQGTGTLCPNAVGKKASSDTVQELGGSAQPGGDSDSDGGSAGATATKTVISEVPSKATISPTSSSIFTITKSVFTKTTSSTSPSGTTTVVIPTTVTPDTNSNPAWPTDPSAYPASTSTSFHSSPTPNNNGGGTILDIGSSAPPTARISTKLLSFVAGLCASVYFL